MIASFVLRQRHPPIRPKRSHISPLRRVTPSKSTILHNATGRSRFSPEFSKNYQVAEGRVPWVPPSERRAFKKERKLKAKEEKRTEEYHDALKNVKPFLVADRAQEVPSDIEVSASVINDPVAAYKKAVEDTRLKYQMEIQKKQVELKNEAKATDDQNDQVNKTKSFKPNIGNAIKASLDQLTVAMRKQKSAELKRLREEAATKKPQLIAVPGLSISPNDAVTYENLEEKIDQMLQNGASYSIQTVGSLEKRSNVTYKTAMELSKLEFAKLEKEKAKLTKQIEIMSILNEGVEAPADPEGDNEKISAEAQ